MRFWLIYREEDTVKNKAYIESYIKLAPGFGLECRLVLVSELVCGIKDGKPFVKGPEPLPAFAVVRTIHPDLSRQLELCGVRCFNSSEVSRICNNKAYTYAHLSNAGIPMPDTVFVKNRDLPAFLAGCEKGKVIKSVSGHGGAQVTLYDGDPDRILKLVQGDDVVVQERIGHKARDLRVYCLGDRIIASVLRESDEDFRANFSLGGNVSLYALKPHEKRLVKQITDRLKFDLVGIDFLLDESDNLIFNEIEDVVGARMLYKVSDIDIVAEYLAYIRSQI